MSLDPRLRVGATPARRACLRRMYAGAGRRRISGFGAGVPPGLGLEGDTDDVLPGRAPRPDLETVGEAAEGDAGFVETHARARHAELDAAERDEAVAYDGGHVLRRDRRERSYAWFRRSL